MASDDNRPVPGKRGSPTVGDNGLNLAPGSAAKKAQVAMDFLSWGKVDKNDVGAMRQRLKKYIEYCAEHDVKIGNMTCYAAVGITRDDAYNWVHGRTQTEAHAELIRDIQSLCSMTREMLMQDGELNVVCGIFWQKNFDGMKDVQDVVVSPGSPLGNATDPNEVARKYAEQLPEAGNSIVVDIDGADGSDSTDDRDSNG